MVASTNHLPLIAFLLAATSTQARIPPSSRPPPGIVASRHHSSLQLQSSARSSLFGVLRVRGGDLSEDESDIEEHGDVDASDDEEELAAESVDESDLESEAEEVEETQQQEESNAAESSSMGPVKLSIKTNLNCPISDQSLEFTASGKRTVESLKQAISKSMRGRPPQQILVLKHSGRTLSDDETVSSILSEVDSDDEDSDKEDMIGEEDLVKLKLTLDILPPIDPKFGTEFKEKVDRMSTKELVQAYCLNVAGMKLGIELGEGEMEEYDRLLEGNSNSADEDAHGHKEMFGSGSIEKGRLNQSLHIRKQAALLQRQMEKSFGDETIQLMEEEHERVQAYLAEGNEHTSSSDVVYGLVPEAALTQRSRKGRAVKGGASMNIKRVLQKNMNVNWADTTRNSLLFLFFGYFGGRNSFSRTFLLLSAPLCFLLQTRPIKVAIKQAFYAIGEPPGILLSLLPAPQQAIMSLDYKGFMRDLYGEEVIRSESWYGDAEVGSDDEDEEDEDEEDADDYDDGEEEYDSDDEY